jgi:hypothetical protein
MMTRGDNYYMAVCNLSGTLAIYNENKNIFLSPFVDGPIQFNHTQMNEIKLDMISKNGRDFSIVQVPYSFKLLMHELQTMNIQLRVITEDNIQQYLEFSDNFKKMSDTNTMKEVSDALFEKLNMGKLRRRPQPLILPDTAPGAPYKYGDSLPEPEIEGEYDYTDDTMENPYSTPPPETDWGTQYLPQGLPSMKTPEPLLTPTTPDYSVPPAVVSPQIPQSPPYVPQSPPYVPQSPPYVPQSPPYVPQSPPYVPQSPISEVQNEIINPPQQKSEPQQFTDVEGNEYVPTTPTYTPPDEREEGNTVVVRPSDMNDFRKAKTDDGREIWINNTTGKYYFEDPFK